MTQIQTEIIPSKPTFVGETKTIDYKAICVFAATGFFLDDDTYFKGQKVLKPASKYTINESNDAIESCIPFFKWHYTPVDRPFEQIVNEFAVLFEKIINEQVGDRKVILPLSGGLDSRTQAAALHYLKKDVQSYSYEFQNGLNETYFAQKLLDYEMASNVGNWQWAAGSGVDAAPYFRIFNPTEQIKKFDKDLKYIKKWIPELETQYYPKPIVDHKEARERCLKVYKEAVG